MTKYLSIITCAALLFVGTACKDQLNVGNPNSPTFGGNVTDEVGITSLAQGAVYINGFQNNNGWLGDSYFSLQFGYLEVMADHVGIDASNNQFSTMGIPDYFLLDDGSKQTNTAPQISIIRSFNNRASTGAGNNALYYQWNSAYALNNACNTVLELVDGIKFSSGDAASKKNTIKAWCYFWKGYAYAAVGSLYYSGLIVDKSASTNGNYALSSAIIAESNKNYNLAATTLGAITSVPDYQSVLGNLIPAFNQVGLGQVPTQDMWKRSINTMLARNIVCSKISPFVKSNLSAAITKSSTSVMTAADWASVLSLTNNGIKNGDYVFTGRTTASNPFFGANGGTVAALTAKTNTNSTFKITERFVQSYNKGDMRLDNGFNTATTYNNSFNYSTRYSAVDGGNGMAGVNVFASKTVGAFELYIAGSYEENALMQAEASIRTGATEAGLAYVDAVRKFQGAGVTAVAGKGLTASQAMTELTKERRVALFGRGVAFYDLRRWGWTYDIANGGGSYGNTMLFNAKLNTNVTINYNFLDFWDVPADESVLNPSTSGVATKNPNF